MLSPRRTRWSRKWKSPPTSVASMSILRSMGNRKKNRSSGAAFRKRCAGSKRSGPRRASRGRGRKRKNCRFGGGGPFHFPASGITNQKEELGLVVFWAAPPVAGNDHDSPPSATRY